MIFINHELLTKKIAIIVQTGLFIKIENKYKDLV